MGSLLYICRMWGLESLSSSQGHEYIWIEKPGQVNYYLVAFQYTKYLVWISYLLSQKYQNFKNIDIFILNDVV